MRIKSGDFYFYLMSRFNHNDYLNSLVDYLNNNIFMNGGMSQQQEVLVVGNLSHHMNTGPPKLLAKP